MVSPRVLYLTEAREVLGGGVRATRSLIEALVRVHRVPQIAFFGPAAGADPIHGVQYYPNDGSRPFSLDFLLALRGAIREFKPEVVHAMGLYTGTIAQILRYRLLDYRLVITVHHAAPPRFRFLAQRVAWWLGSRIDCVTFLTDYQATYYSEQVGFRPKNWAIIPNVVPKELPDQATTMSLRASLLERTSSEYLIGYAGRLIPSKQLDMFLRTIAALRTMGISVGGFIVGTGSQEYISSLIALSTELGVAHSVVFEGFKTKPELYIAASDLILFPTLQEALPNLLVESYMLGKPIVLSPIAALASLVKHRVDSIVADEHNPDSYARVVKEVLTSNSLRERISKAARLTYSQVFDPYVVSRKYWDIYRTICGHSQQPAPDYRRKDSDML